MKETEINMNELSKVVSKVFVWVQTCKDIRLLLTSAFDLFTRRSILVYHSISSNVKTLYYQHIIEEDITNYLMLRPCS